ncbi:MAG TPA: hypothetical protein VNB64_01905 [Solirubrobacteraceae bacterium]|nr:hypothetical protein [Solirubrobacteraceae bacterium]
MRATRALALLLAVTGAGLVSGSLAQVAALDRDLERAVLDRPAPVERTVDRVECRRDRGHWRDS